MSGSGTRPTGTRRSRASRAPHAADPRGRARRRATSPTRSGACAPGASTYRAASSARAARRTRRRSESSSPACGPWRRRMITDANERERLLAALLERRLAGRERPLRPVRRPLRARDADARGRAARARRRAHPAVGGVSEQRSGASCRAGSAGRPRSRARPTLERALGRGGVAQARGPRAHGRAQDQQRHRPSAAREGARREARRRRDRRGPARRRGGGRVRARRLAVHGVHGRGRRRAPSAERRPHAAGSARPSCP